MPEKSDRESPADGAKQEDDEDLEVEENKPPSTSRRSIALIIFLVAAVSVYFLLLRKKEVPPSAPPHSSISVDAEKLYKAYQEGLEFLIKGKVSYQRGQNLLSGKPIAPEITPVPAGPSESMPEGAGTSHSAENFAMAVEQFDQAKNIVDKAKSPASVKDEERECGEDFIESADKYKDAAKIYNEFAKAKYAGDQARAEKYPPSDANAKFEMAERLMAKNLLEGCHGQYFEYARNLPPDQKAKIFTTYEQFFGEKFSSYRPAFLVLLGISASTPAP